MRQHLCFYNILEVIPALKEEIATYGDLVEYGRANSRDIGKACREIIGLSFQLFDWYDRDEMLKENGLSKEFCEADFADRMNLTPVNPGTAIKYDISGVLRPYLNEHGYLSYTYSERIYYQISPIIYLLRSYPNTRQAFMSVWDPNEDIDALEIDRVPCSIGYHFLIRNDKLIMIYIMRSLEISRCLGNDLYTASKMLEYVAEQVGVAPGYIQFNIGSAHIFE
jgi:thymidylate synthase